MSGFVLDCSGNRVYEGDLVRCVTSYLSVLKGEVKRIIRVEEPNIVLANALSPIGTSIYRPDNFRLERANSQSHRNQELRQMVDYVHAKDKPVLHIAVRLDDSSLGTFIERIYKFGLARPTNLTGSGAPVGMLINANADALKNEIRARIRIDNTEKWLILSGNTIGEIAEQPVRFRSA